MKQNLSIRNKNDYTVKQRQARYRARRNRAGDLERSYWATPEQHERIKAFLQGEEKLAK